MREEETINLWASYEQKLLAHAIPTQTEIPACVITGFLGSGKTTLLAHLLRHRGGLRMGVLINEVGAVDLDSQLIDVGHVHASHGLPGPGEATSLAGGCVCCSAAGGLEASLATIKAAAGGGLDYLVVETSGVADAEPLAGMLTKHGFRLEVVVALVDAEAGTDTLKQPIAQAQIRCADVVVVNKCDLAGLGSASDVEDAVQRLSPGVRMIRARYGQVPVPSLLDVELDVQGSTTANPGPPLANPGHSPSGPADLPGGTAPPPRVQGEVAFLSHEPMMSGQAGPRYKVAGRLSKIAVPVLKDGGNGTKASNGTPSSQTMHTHATNGHVVPTHPHSQQPHAHTHAHAGHVHGAEEAQGHGHSHASLHEGFHTVSVTSERPVRLADFQVFVAVLTHLPGVYRSKGILWFSDLRQHPYTFHLSGRQRVECLRGEPWAAPPRMQLVIIGADPQLLNTLREAFEALIQSPPPSAVDAPQPPPGHEGPSANITLLPSTPSPSGTMRAPAALTERPSGAASPGVGAGAEGRGASAGHISIDADHHTSHVGVDGDGAAAVVRRGLGVLHERLDVVEPAHGSSEGPAMLLVEFSVRGEPLHGVRGPEVTASMLRRAGASLLPSLGLLPLGIPEPPAICGVGGGATHGAGERVLRVQLLVDGKNNPLLSRAVAAVTEPCDAPGLVGGHMPAQGHSNSVPGLTRTVSGQAGTVSGQAAHEENLTMECDHPEDGMHGDGSCGSVLERLVGLIPAQGQGQVLGGVGHKTEGGAVTAGGVVLRALQECCVPVLRRAFPHAGCRCDVVGAMNAR